MGNIFSCRDNRNICQLCQLIRSKKGCDWFSNAHFHCIHRFPPGIVQDLIVWLQYFNRFLVFINSYKGKSARNGKLAVFGIHLLNEYFNEHFHTGIAYA